MTTSDDIGRAIYETTGFDTLSPPAASAIANRLAGPGVLYRQPHSVLESYLATIDGRRRIVLRQGTPPARANFLVAEMTARLFLEGEAWFRASERIEQAELQRDVGAWLVAPPDTFFAFFRQVGLNLRTLADAFTITQTCASMRIPEVGGPDAIVTTPDRVYRRGKMLRWVRDDDVRELAAKPNPRSVRKVVIRDEPGRVALLAKA